MAQRLFRAKTKIRTRGDPVPGAARPTCCPSGWPPSLAVLYLLFNEGYSATAGDDLVRQGLTAEAIRLARVLAALMPDEPEALGLLALMLLQDARRPARVDAAGDLVPLEEQDRVALAAAADRRGSGHARRRPAPRPAPGSYQIQAAIAACHADAATRRPRPTGPRSPGSTATWYGWRHHRSSSSTAPSRSRWRTGRRPVSNWSTSSPPPARSTATTCSPPPAPTCCGAWAATTRPPRATAQALEQVRTEPERRYLTRRLGALPPR